MTGVVLSKSRSMASSINTREEYDRDVFYEDVERRVERLACAMLNHGQMCCYIFGMGGLSTDAYSSIGNEKGIDIIFSRSTLNRYLSFLKRFVASQEGLVRVDDFSKLQKVFSIMTDRSMATIYCFNKEFERDFVTNASTNLKHAGFDFGVKEDKSYLIYLADSDNYESKTGVIEFISIGVSTPEDLVLALR
jgi:hypothetical protein